LQQQYCVAAKTLCCSKNTVLQQKHCVAATTLCCSVFVHAFDICTVRIWVSEVWLCAWCGRSYGVWMWRRQCGCGGVL